MGVRLLATDLDRTLLDGQSRLSDENRAALAECHRRGIMLVVATGRARSTVPEEITGIPGVRYLICANGAKVHDNHTGAVLRQSCLSDEAIEYVAPLLRDPEVLPEFFWDGVPWVEQSRYESHAGVPGRFLEYFRASRKPVKDIGAALSEHAGEIENINFVFDSDAAKERILAFLKKGERLYELTSSFAFNFEIGGVGVSKAAAAAFIAEREGIDPKDAIAFGDSENDIKLIEWAGIGVAMGNAVPAVKAAADHIADTNERSGVARALYELKVI